MRIGMILDLDFPPDMRVENEAITLTKASHEVFILCFDYTDELPKVEIYHGITILRIFKTKKWANRGRGLINTPFDFYTRFWTGRIAEFIAVNKIDVLHIHDLYLLGAAYNANKKHNLPVVSDLHENYVDGLKSYRFANTFPGNILISKRKWTEKEIEWCRRADYLITVIEEAVIRYTSLGVNIDNISVVANYVNTERFSATTENKDILDKFAGVKNILYIGGFDIHRGLETVIESMSLIVSKYPSTRLILVGDGRNCNDLKELSKKLAIDQNVSFEGFQDATNLPSYIKVSDVCLIPHLKTMHTDNTIPHKLFHYMLMGKPVIASDCNPLKRIISDVGCGLIYPGQNSSRLTESILALLHDDNKRMAMGKKGQDAVFNKYNWNNTGRNLTNLYHEILKG